MRERALADSIMPKLRAFGGSWHKTPVSPYGNSGISDITGCLRGRYVEIELKAPGRYTNPEQGLSPLQAQHKAEILRAGGWHICADNWSTIEQQLRFLLLTLPSDDLGPNPNEIRRYEAPL